jgi:pteridine reductase
MTLIDKTIIVTGAAKRIGKHLAVTLAASGANVVLHYSFSKDEALETASIIEQKGVKVFLVEADLSQPELVQKFLEKALKYGNIYGLVNNAAIFDPVSFEETTLEKWQNHLNINLTAPFLLCQGFARQIQSGMKGRIVNILDWRALRPGKDHFPYTISKNALAAMTKSLAQVLAPSITVNGLALGAVLPPSSGGNPHNIIENIPAKRWADLDEVGQALLFLMDGPEYITGEIIHVDGGRHLV